MPAPKSAELDTAWEVAMKPRATAAPMIGAAAATTSIVTSVSRRRLMGAVSTRSARPASSSPRSSRVRR